MVSSRGKFPCKPKATKRQLDEDTFALSCALDNKDWDNGNHLVYTVGTETGSGKDYLELRLVNGELCEPKPKDCNCKTMLAEVLEANPTVNWINGYFNANPFIAGCRCYLGVAANKGFRFVETIAVSEGRFEFTKSDYVQICEDLEKKLPEGFDITRTPITAKITKA